jgi:hypothetical protein
MEEAIVRERATSSPTARMKTNAGECGLFDVPVRLALEIASMAEDMPRTCVELDAILWHDAS